MNWHEPTQAEIDGEGEHAFIVDVMPDHVPYMAATDGNALIRISRPGWSWRILDLSTSPASIPELGLADTREAAIVDGIAKLAQLREKGEA